MNAGRDFENKIVVKVNAPEVLRRELAAKRWNGEHIAMGTGTDPYQRAEGRYRLMRGIIQALIDHRNPFSILTKGTLILRDLDLLQQAAEVAPVSAAFSIGTLDEQVWRETEPGTPHPKARMEAVRDVDRRGDPDRHPDGADPSRTVRRARSNSGPSSRPRSTQARPTSRRSSCISGRGFERSSFPGWRTEHPDLVERYLGMYRQPYGPKAMRDGLGREVSSLVAAAGGVRRGVEPARRFFRRERSPGAKEHAEQLRLL